MAFQRRDGRRPVARAPPAGQLALKAGHAPLVASESGLGLGITSPVESTAKALTPTSTPATPSGRAGVRSARLISTPKLTNHRPARSETVAETTRAEPEASGPSRAVVGSLVRTTPIRGSRTWRPSRTPNAPVE